MTCRGLLSALFDYLPAYFGCPSIFDKMSRLQIFNISFLDLYNLKPICQKLGSMVSYVRTSGNHHSNMSLTVTDTMIPTQHGPQKCHPLRSTVTQSREHPAAFSLHVQLS